MYPLTSKSPRAVSPIIFGKPVKGILLLRTREVPDFSLNKMTGNLRSK